MILEKYKTVKCSFPDCSGRRIHFESPDIRRPHRSFKVPIDHEGYAYCSFECKCYHEATLKEEK